MNLTRNSRSPKVTPINEDYEITNTVLGLGINGKVVECFSKKTKEKFALKVTKYEYKHDSRITDLSFLLLLRFYITAIRPKGKSIYIGELVDADT